MTQIKIKILAFSFIIALVSCDQPKLADPFGAQIDDLMTKMTLEEKIGQMTLFTSDWDQTGPTLREGYKEDIKTARLGALFNAHTAAYTREMQRIAIEETRLGIPLLFGYDVIHGYKTIFPIPLAEAASWDLEAIEKSARIAAEEATAAGLHWTFAPMVDIARDPRWGRIAEGAGEDTYLGSLIAQARVRGFQGSDLSAPNTMIACAKHFAAYGAAQAGRDYHTVDISDRVLRSTYLPPFKAAMDAGVRTFMTSFNELDGVPASGSKYLLTDVLRSEWNFDGFVVTDYTSINEMIPHGYATDEKHAGELALSAGVDMDMQGAVFYDHLAQSIDEGVISESQVNHAVSNILRIKFELGLFEDPYRYSDEARESNVILTDEHLAHARDMARKSVVLLKNADDLLPLSADQRIALIGPLADSKSDLLGSWHAAGSADDCISIVTGMRERAKDGSRISYAKGCEVDDDDRSGFAEARELALQSEVIVAVLGEAEWMSGEAASRSSIGLPGIQNELVKMLAGTGKSLVVIIMSGRPLAIPSIVEESNALLEVWFPGTMGGPAIADVLYGDYNPSGRLPVTFPRNEGQIPIYYGMKNTGRPFDAENKYTSKYLDIENTPLFPFGFGLSYTTFEYSNLIIDKKEFSVDDEITLSVDVKNTGERVGEETVQLYVRDIVGSVTRPLKELKGYLKIQLNPGEAQTVTFVMSTDDLKFYNKNMEFVVEAGKFEIFIGANSSSTESVIVELK